NLYQPLFRWDVGRQSIEHGRLAASRPAADDQRDPPAHRRFEHIHHRRADRSDFDEALHVQRALGEFADRHQRTVNRDRPYGDMHTRAVRQAGIDHGRGFVNASAHAGYDLADDPQQMGLILEMDLGFVKFAEALDETKLVSVDQNVGDGWVFQQRLDRAKAG